jgi:hypothetical protein
MDLLQQALSALLPKQWLEYFEVTEITEKNKEWNIILTEKADRVSAPLIGKDAVLNGFLNPVEIYDFPLRGKPAYLKFFRRRWKEQEGSAESYFNTYDFHPKGMKPTEEFGDFLKGFDRRETDQLLGDIPIYEDSGGKGPSLVSRGLERIFPKRSSGRTPPS